MKQFHLILLMFLLFLSGCAQRITPPDEHLQQNRPESY
ncbi:outer membrane lipoprotein LolB, partial [Pseudoalteromonas sp. S981]